jgi:hypothetical protein
MPRELIEPNGRNTVYGARRRASSSRQVEIGRSLRSSKHKLILPDLNHAVADVEARVMKLPTRPPFNAVTAPRQPYAAFGSFNSMK